MRIRFDQDSDERVWLRFVAPSLSMGFEIIDKITALEPPGYRWASVKAGRASRGRRWSFTLVLAMTQGPRIDGEAFSKEIAQALFGEEHTLH